MAGLYGFFCFVFVAVGAVRLKWWGGWFGFLFIFSILLLAFLVGGCLW
jgi:hypothetical protein